MGLAALLFLVRPLAASPNWEDVRLVVEPGVGVSGLTLNDKLPEEWPKQLGQPDHILPFDDTGEGYRRLSWGEMEKGQLKKGVTLMVVGHKDQSSVLEVTVRRVRASVKDSELFLGLGVDRLGKRSKQLQKDGTTSYQLPGVLLEAREKKVTGLSVRTPAETRWRFTHWVARPGREVGPIKLGEPINDALWQAIGEPHKKTKEKVSWSSREGGQQLLIVRDPQSMKVILIRGIGIPWRTDRGVTLGDHIDTYKAKHRKAKEGVGRTFDQPVMKLPGLRATFENGKLRGFDVFPIPKAQ